MSLSQLNFNRYWCKNDWWKGVSESYLWRNRLHMPHRYETQCSYPAVSLRSSSNTETQITGMNILTVMVTVRMTPKLSILNVIEINKITIKTVWNVLVKRTLKIEWNGERIHTREMLILTLHEPRKNVRRFRQTGKRISMQFRFKQAALPRAKANAVWNPKHGCTLMIENV
jgi:hypothetical protein